MKKHKVIRVTTVPISLSLIKGQLRFLSQYYEILAVSGSSSTLYKFGQSEGVRVSAVDMERKISPLRDIVSLFKLYLLFLREKPTIVHSLTPKAGLLTMLAGKMASVPIRMHTFTGLIFPTRKGLIQKTLIAMDRLLCWAATDIYPEGEGVKKDLTTFNITSKPLKVLANGNVNGIDTTNEFSINLSCNQTKSKIREELAIREGDFVFIFVGRVVKDKGINELVDAFNKLNVRPDRSDNSKVNHLVIVGEYEKDMDPLFPETEKIIQQHPNIHFVGFKSNVVDYFAIADVLTFPSYREGFPNVVMQAGAMDLPSIVSDINGCNEIIINGLNGIIIPPRDSLALYNAMLTIMEDAELRTRLRENARKMIIERYERKVVWDALLAEYKRLEKNV